MRISDGMSEGCASERVAASLVVVALLAGVNVTDDGTGGGPDQQIAAPSLEDVAREVMNDPEATRVVLRASEGELEAPAAIAADGSGYLMGSTLPALSEAETYQLWGIKGDLVVSLGVLGPPPGGKIGRAPCRESVCQCV